MLRRFLCTPLAFVLAIAAAHAQSNYAVVRGSILDPERRPVAGARVHITANGNGAEREVVANEAGLYEIAGLQPGNYKLAVNNPGFAGITRVIDLEVGQQATFDFQLHLAGESQTVTVRAAG